ncbi:hypothetical protein [Xanthomonas translucens]
MHQHYASAGALLRPLLEAAACAFWFMYYVWTKSGDSVSCVRSAPVAAQRALVTVS